MKYELTEETKVLCGHTLHRVKYADGTLGGWVGSKSNLSEAGDARVLDEACVYGKAVVSGDAQVYGDANVFCEAVVGGNARVYGDTYVLGLAKVSGDVQVCENAIVGGNARVYGEAQVGGDAVVCELKDFIVIKNWWSSGRYLTYTRSNRKWRAGCFYGTSEELVEKAYQDSEESGRHHQELVDYVNRCFHGDAT